MYQQKKGGKKVWISSLTDLGMQGSQRKVDSFPAVSWPFLLSMFENLALEDKAGKNNGISVCALGWERGEAGEEPCFEDAG